MQLRCTGHCHYSTCKHAMYRNHIPWQYGSCDRTCPNEIRSISKFQNTVTVATFECTCSNTKKILLSVLINYRQHHYYRLAESALATRSVRRNRCSTCRLMNVIGSFQWCSLREAPLRNGGIIFERLIQIWHEIYFGQLWMTHYLDISISGPMRAELVV